MVKIFQEAYNIQAKAKLVVFLLKNRASAMLVDRKRCSAIGARCNGNASRAVKTRALRPEKLAKSLYPCKF